MKRHVQIISGESALQDLAGRKSDDEASVFGSDSEASDEDIVLHEAASEVSTERVARASSCSSMGAANECKGKFK